MAGVISVAKSITPQFVKRIISKRLGPSPSNLTPWNDESLAADAAVFSKSQRAAENIDGMLSTFSMAAMDSLLSLQKAKGAVLEFGTYKGRSAAILANRVAPDEKFILVDIADYLDLQAIRSINPGVDFVQCASREFRRKYPDFRSIRKKSRLVHVDTSHSYRDTYSEMRLCDELLSPEGIAVFDDFTNLNYSQILPAIYKYIYTNRTDLCVFMVTDEKCYLCRKSHLNNYLSFVLQGIIRSMAVRGINDAMIARSDWHREYRAIYLRTKSDGETGDRYGEEIYGNFYAGP
ncbi:class I SAM-dependent methyltransferase [Rhizobium leguminosarum]|uniref:class I SAM-dependent methyltransferase n=1 Tax=Rhizobium leguminosarum TaxID=384 RepID=UPI000480D670|nr:class I SAM-dependent methyltransferase [Rhizobium leguminosarum]